MRWRKRSRRRVSLGSRQICAHTRYAAAVGTPAAAQSSAMQHTTDHKHVLDEARMPLEAEPNLCDAPSCFGGVCAPSVRSESRGSGRGTRLSPGIAPTATGPTMTSTPQTGELSILESGQQQTRQHKDWLLQGARSLVA
eukprot:scaffold1419_cov410-Prasinococcus_capsulatus_cf.AAC.18